MSTGARQRKPKSEKQVGFCRACAPGVSGPWMASGPQKAPASGPVEFWDLFPLPGQGFYRAVGP